MQTDNVAIYETIRILPEHERPAYIFRKDCKTIVAIDPRDSRCDIAWVLVNELDLEEHNAFRAAWGCGPVGTETDEHYVNDEPCLLYVPRGLRLAGEAALQGGPELARRLREDLLVEELLMLNQELLQSQAG